MSSPTLPRPSQVTLAGWMIIIGSVLVVFSVFELLSGMRSLETRQSVEAFLEDAPGEALGLDVEGVLNLWRTVALIAAGCATGAAVLGWHVLRRHRGARVGLTVLAVPLFLTGVATGGFVSSLVAAASLMLWLQPARDWFDGKRPADAERTTPRSPVQDPAPASEPHPPLVAPSGQETSGPDGQPVSASSPPRPFQGFGDPTAAPPPVPGLGQPATTSPGSAVPAKRPDSVLIAAVVTWVLAGLTLLMALVSIALVLLRPESLMEELERQDPEVMAQSGVTQTMVVSTAVLMAGMLALWALLAIVLAVLTMRRSAGAAAALLVSAVFTALFCFAGALAAPPLLFPAAGAVVVALALRRPDVRAWLLSGRSRPPSPYGP